MCFTVSSVIIQDPSLSAAIKYNGLPVINEQQASNNIHSVQYVVK